MNFGKELIKAANGSVALAKEKAPLILTLGSIGLGISSTVMAVRVTPDAKDICDQIDADPDLTEEEKKIEKFKNVAPLYAPAVLAGAGSVTCGILSYAIQEHRLNKAYETIGALSAGYILAQDRLKDYKEEVKKKYGEEADNDIEQELVKKDARRHPEKYSNLGIVDEGVDKIFVDGKTHIPFKAREKDVYRGFQVIALDVHDSVEHSVADLIYEITKDADLSYCEASETLGWVPGSFSSDDIFPTIIPTHLDDGREAFLIKYDTDPYYTEVCKRNY